MFHENEYRASNGLTSMVVLLLVAVAAFLGLMRAAQAQMPAGVLASFLVLILAFVSLTFILILVLAFVSLTL